MKKQPEDMPGDKLGMNDVKLNELLALLRKTKDSEIDCDAFWELGPSLAEGGRGLSAEDMQNYLYHLEMCPGCHENFEILKSIVQNQ